MHTELPTEETNSSAETSVSKGYKQTKLGWIPKDWSTPKIEDVFQFLKTSSYSRKQLNYDQGDVFYIHYGDIHATYKKTILDFEKEVLVPRINKEVKLPNNVDFLKDGDVVIADASEDYEGIGEAIEMMNLNGRKVISGLHTFALRDTDRKTVKGFRAYIFKSYKVKRALKTIATGSKVYGISKGNVQKFNIILPPLSEQQKIAQILSTWDKAIALQEQLIAEKQALKKGLMQELLTGKKRFPGFTEEWEVVKLEEVCDFKNGKGHEQNIDAAGKFVVVNSKFISSNGFVRKHTNSQISPLHKNDIVMVMSDVPNGRALAKCYLIDENEKFSLNQRICALTPKNINTKFLYYQLNRNKYYLKFNDGLGQTNLKKKEVLNCPILVPSPNEQEKIVQVIEASNDSLTSLNVVLDNMKKQKQGLMQQLLTGEKRVNV
ncbi:restriction endonuclease subunit S [Zunongwangia sp. SCSIO 43204]|uniref:restriction endonuclease subunit S n=1 Tax=Zunongwangia sp. SCSIO 43204 TaxID=2779359 RepID=UPI001CA8E8A2|nr:restriction endonuclease subunit S [Zunongwangia sp. SCSIO 43204]UAB82854.1 restriction endonuclease subunit S [Zunongwangia sp. SCSIO 43204]